MAAVKSATTVVVTFDPPPRCNETTGRALNLLGLLLKKPFNCTLAIVTRSYFMPIRPGEEGNATTKTMEKAKRFFAFAFGGPACIASAALDLTGSLLDYMGDCMTKKEYYALQGGSPMVAPSSKTSFSFAQFNACMFPSLLPTLYGGCSQAALRYDALAARIREANPDFLAMQEVGFEAGLALHQRLRDYFRCFFTHIGQYYLGLGTGLFLASKYPPVSPPLFFDLSKSGALRRGIFCVEFDRFWVLVTHLSADDKNIKERIAQLEFIYEMTKLFKKPFFLLGDLNVPRTGDKGDEYSTSGIADHFVDPGPLKWPKLTVESATCTDTLTAYALGVPSKEPYTIFDYALLNKAAKTEFTLEIRLEDTIKTKLSDHRMIHLTATPV